MAYVPKHWGLASPARWWCCSRYVDPNTINRHMKQSDDLGMMFVALGASTMVWTSVGLMCESFHSHNPGAL